MSNVYQDVGLTMMITTEDHLTAQQFYAQHQDARKGKQVYLNTLAVRAVERYLNYFGIHADLEKSMSTDVISQHLLDTGALHIPDSGDIECRPVLAHESSVYVPEEVHSDRLGYVAVQLDETLNTAILIGFTKTATHTQIPLKNLESIEALLEIVSKSEVTLSATNYTTHEQVGQVVQLQQWFNQVFEAGWLAAEEFFLTTPLQLAHSFRGSLQENFMPTIPTNGVVGAKLLEQAGKQMALCVGLSPDTKKTGEVNISVELYPVNGNGMLPENVTLTVLDAMGKAVIESQPICDVEYQFSGETGEQFSIQISLGQDEFSFLETFLI
ncbi:MAG: DUF1822 family protein [Leptolyngbya sp. SIO1D8]|nr:DUF1822 family protein [Leptolyngbya sp. SIO1D8]